MKTEFKIEQNVPLVARGGKAVLPSSSYPFGKMQKGDSFIIGKYKTQRIYQHILML